MIEMTKTGGTRSRSISGVRFGLAASAVLAASCALVTSAMAADGANPPISRQSASQGGTTVGPIYYPPDNQNISGVWWTESYEPVLQVVGGGEIPYNEAGVARNEELRAGIASGEITDEARRVCVPDGLPRILTNPYPFQIIQTPGQITFIYELNHVIRPIKLDVPQASELDLEIFPYYMGHSVGRWEGDTLIVESAGFNEKTWFDSTGAASSWQKTTVETIRKLDDGTLELTIEVNDPMYLTESFSARYVYNMHDDVRLEDYNCGDEHRDISHIEGVNPQN